MVVLRVTRSAGYTAQSAPADLAAVDADVGKLAETFGRRQRQRMSA